MPSIFRVLVLNNRFQVFPRPLFRKATEYPPRLVHLAILSPHGLPNFTLLGVCCALRIKCIKIHESEFLSLTNSESMPNNRDFLHKYAKNPQAQQAARQDNPKISDFKTRSFFIRKKLILDRFFRRRAILKGFQEPPKSPIVKI
jgi:hypothetical protein